MPTPTTRGATKGTPRRCVRCGADGRRVVLGYRRVTWLCREHTTELFKLRRRRETARLSQEYGEVDTVAARAEAHHIALSAVTAEEIGCEVDGLPADVAACLAALRARSVAYFRTFDDQAYRRFPSARDRARGRGHLVRAVARGAFTLAYDVPFLRWLYGDRCVYCGAASEHLDHVWPLVLGGDDASWNLAPACQTCNLAKGGKTLGAWLPSRVAGLDEETRETVRGLWSTWTT